MNVTHIDRTLDLFHSIGFTNLKRNSLLQIDDHFQAANRRLIMVMSHTSTHDFLLGLLLFQQSQIPITMFTNFKSPILKRFARSLGMLTHQDNMSNTQSIVQHLKHRKEFGLLISLGRTRENEKVHSSYFYVARELQVPIIVLGFDYFLKTGTVSVQRWLPHPQETYGWFQMRCEPEILEQIQNICPLKLNFQVGFDLKLYPHGNLANAEIQAPNMALLYAHVAKQQVCNVNKSLLLWILFALFVVLFVLSVCLVLRK